jgi:hypothetical protein
MTSSRGLAAWLVPMLLIGVAACSGTTEPAGQAPPAIGPAADVRALTGAPARFVWVQGDDTDPETEGDQLMLMGLDTEDGVGERVLIGEPRSIVKPRLTSSADRIVFSSRILPGPPEIFIVNWDGSGLRKLADGFAMALWRNPADGSDWVYAGTDNQRYDFATVTRFPIDAPARRELVWNTTLVSMEGFAVTPNGRQAGGLWPWPSAGIADLRGKTWKKFGEGCWTSLTDARGPLFWYFDGAHRNVTMVDAGAGTRWMVNLNGAPGFEGAEVSHPRWTNHPRFLVMTGPYNQGGANQVHSGGPQVEVYLGRFSEDFSRVEQWVRVTNNGGGDWHPDAWIDLSRSPYPRQPAGPIGPEHVRSAAARDEGETVHAGRLLLNVRLTHAGPIPDPRSILPYRHGLTVNEYEIIEVLEGTYSEPTIQVAQWAIRDGAVLPDARKPIGGAFTLAVERYDAHPELEGERLLADGVTATRSLYYDAGRR